MEQSNNFINFNLATLFLLIIFIYRLLCTFDHIKLSSWVLLNIPIGCKGIGRCRLRIWVQGGGKIGCEGRLFVEGGGRGMEERESLLGFLLKFLFCQNLVCYCLGSWKCDKNLDILFVRCFGSRIHFDFLKLIYFMAYFCNLLFLFILLKSYFLFDLHIQK